MTKDIIQPNWNHSFFAEAFRQGMFIPPHFLEKMKAVKAHASDLDGTLLLNEKFALNQIQTVIETYWNCKLPSGFVVSMAGKSKEDIIHTCAHTADITNYSDRDLQNILDRIVEARSTLNRDEPIATMHGSENYFYKITQHEKIPTIIATSSERPRVELHLSHHPMLRIHFQDAAGQLIAICAETDLNRQVKPDPLVYITAAETLGVDPKDMATYEDSISGVTSAVRAGIGTIIAITGGDHIKDQSYHANELLAAGAHASVPTFTHLSHVVQPYGNAKCDQDALDKSWFYFYGRHQDKKEFGPNPT